MIQSDEERAARARYVLDVETRARAEARRRLPVLRLEIAAPCKASWDEMVGDAKTRHCLACEKNVHDLTAMSPQEVSSFLATHESSQACIRIFQRVDGTVMRENCPMGISRRRLRGVLLSGLSLAAVALGCFTGLALLHARDARASQADPFGTSTPLVHTRESQLGFLTVLAPPGALVVVDGNAMGSNVAGVPLAAGVPHVVKVLDQANGFQGNETVTLGAGDLRTVSLFPTPVRVMGGAAPPPRTVTMGRRAVR